MVVAEASREALEPLPEAGLAAVRLSAMSLPAYAAQTVVRMLAALALSLLFTFTYATLAAKSAFAERLLIPLLDILQSVPILGFISVTVTFFLSLTPGRMAGAELAAIFAIFTSQAWNMAFGFYQSLRTVPEELTDAARRFRLSGWARFWRLEVPFAVPQLVANMMMSMSAGWFFVVASEAITVGETTIALPGIGSFIAAAIAERDLTAILWALAAMLVVILLYDQLLFRPLIAWSERFRLDTTAGAPSSCAWLLDMLRHSRLVHMAASPFATVWRRSVHLRFSRRGRAGWRRARLNPRFADGAGLLLAALALWRVASFALSELSLGEAAHTVLLALATMVRVFVLLAAASAVWVPIGVMVGLRPGLAVWVQPLAQILAAFPANLLFPFVVAFIVRFDLSADVWLSPLMVLGTQWYILFNVIAGASAIPSDLRDIAANLHVRGALWWRTVALPAVFPYYVTGAITASGGAWNASIVAETARWGEVRVSAHGLGAFIAHATEAGDFPRIVLGITVMSLVVVLLDRLVWRPLYALAEQRYRLG